MNLTTNRVGALGEAKAITDFMAHGFDVFTQFSGNHPFDFIAYRDNSLWIVEVKSTTKISKRDSYEFGLRGTAYGPDRSVIHKPLNTNIDILVCYIQPLDVLCYVKAEDIENCNTIAFRESIRRHGGSSPQRLISDYNDLEKVI